MPDSSRLTPTKAAEQAAREARLARALRDNLRRRKQHARVRRDNSGLSGDDPGSDRGEAGAGEPPA